MYLSLRRQGERLIPPLIKSFNEFASLIKDWGRDVILLLKKFWADVRSKNRARQVSAFVAFAIVMAWTAIIPGYQTVNWILMKWRVLSLSVREWPHPSESELWQSIEKFTNDYSNAFGSNCEWFRGHDTDIAMWREHERLRREDYSCPGFQQYSHVKLFPISIGVPEVESDITIVDSRLGRVDYNQSEAERYTTVQATIWKLNDESDWRIDKMKNIQRWDLVR